MNEDILKQIEEMLENEQKNNEVSKLRAKVNILNRIGVKYTIVVEDEDKGEYADLVDKVLEW